MKFLFYSLETRFYKLPTEFLEHFGTSPRNNC